MRDRLDSPAGQDSEHNATLLRVCINPHCGELTGEQQVDLWRAWSPCQHFYTSQAPGSHPCSVMTLQQLAVNGKHQRPSHRRTDWGLPATPDESTLRATLEALTDAGVEHRAALAVTEWHAGSVLAQWVCAKVSCPLMVAFTRDAKRYEHLGPAGLAATLRSVPNW